MASASSLTDLSYEAQELSSLLLNTSSCSAEILNACRAVESFLQRHNTDQVRHFYVICFPVLLRKIFGYEENFQASFTGPPAAGWIAQSCDYAGSALVNLLSPSRTLFSSIMAADNENLVRYVFPIERLPAWIPEVLQSERGFSFLPEICPALFKGRVKEDGAAGLALFQVQLNIFEYFIFWFAYYAVCKDMVIENSAEFNGNEFKVGVRRASRSRFEKWTYSFSGLNPSQGRGSSGKLDSKPYLYLANLYLHHFVPVAGFDPSPPPYMQHFVGEDRALFSLSEFVFHTFVQFWLVDRDLYPLPLPICQSLNISLAFESPCYRYVPPNADHLEAIRILVNYVNSSLWSPEYTPASFSKSQVELQWKIASQSDALTPSRNMVVFSPWSRVLQRPLYRFILRAFRYWPVGACVKKLHCILDLWLEYLEPWNNVVERQQTMSGMEDNLLSEVENKLLRDPSKAFSSGGSLFKQKSGTGTGFGLSPPGKRSMDESRYDEQWQNYVLANYPFYNSLVFHFLVFANKFVHIDTEAVLQMTHKVLNVLASSRELSSLLRRVELVYNNMISGSASHSFDSLHKLVPTIREQLQEWENDSCKYDKESEMVLFSSQKGARTLQLFNSNDNGGSQILKLLILRAEAWIQTGSGERIPSCLHSLDILKGLAIKIFGLFEIVASTEIVCRHGSESEDGPMTKICGLGHHTWADVKYKGDWMRRPIGDSEIVWLARLLVRVSDWLNHKLGLEHQATAVINDNNRDTNSKESTNTSEPTFADITEDGDVFIVKCLSDWSTWKKVSSTILCCFMFYSLLLLETIHTQVKRKGWRVNLRILAEKKVFIFLCTCLVIFIATKIFKPYSCALLRSTQLFKCPSVSSFFSDFCLYLGMLRKIPSIFPPNGFFFQRFFSSFRPFKICL